MTASFSGILAALITLTGAFGEVQSALNAIWRAKSRSSTLSRLVRARLASLGLVVTSGFLLTVSLVVSAALAAVSDYLKAVFPAGELALQVADIVISGALLTGMFAAIFKVLPDTPIAWRDVAIGALVTAGLFEGGKYVIALYIGKSDVATSYGAVVHSVTEEGALAETHAHRAVRRCQARTRPHSAVSDEPGIARVGSGGIDDRSHPGVDAVRADQDIRACGRAVCETRLDGIRVPDRIHEPRAGDDADAASGSLRPECSAEAAAPQKERRLVFAARRECSELLAVPALEDDAGHRVAELTDEVAAADDVQRGDAVGREGQAAADGLVRPGVRFEDGGRDTGTLQSHGAYGAGDSATDDGGCPDAIHGRTSFLKGCQRWARVGSSIVG